MNTSINNASLSGMVRFLAPNQSFILAASIQGSLRQSGRRIRGKEIESIGHHFQPLGVKWAGRACPDGRVVQDVSTECSLSPTTEGLP